MILNNFSFVVPTRIEFGVGITEKVGEEAKKFNPKKILIVSDKGVISAGITDKVEKSLKEQNLPYVIYSDFSPNPRDFEMNKAAEFAMNEGIDLIIAVGGGSVLDSAKAIGTLITHGGGSVLDYCGVFKLEREITPLIAIPTTAGTGSEVTPFAVVTNTEKRIKESIWDFKASAKVALMDPSLLLNLPANIMASTGIDALTHAVEAYTCKEATPYTDMFALYAIRLISQNLRQAIAERDLEACAYMLLGSNAAGLAFGFSDVAAVHCMAEALGGKYDIPHGVANAMLLGPVSEFNLSANYKKYADIAIAMGVDNSNLTLQQTAEAGVAEIKKLCKDVGIKSMKEIEIIDPSDFRALAKAAQENTSTPSNPKEMSEELYYQLFNKAYYNN